MGSDREAATKIRPHGRSIRKTKMLSKEQYVELGQQACREGHFFFSKEQLENMWERDREWRRTKPLPRRVKAAREILVVRIQDVLKCPIAVTPAGQFYRLGLLVRFERMDLPSSRRQALRASASCASLNGVGLSVTR